MLREDGPLLGKPYCVASPPVLPVAAPTGATGVDGALSPSPAAVPPPTGARCVPVLLVAVLGRAGVTVNTSRGLAPIAEVGPPDVAVEGDPVADGEPEGIVTTRAFGPGARPPSAGARGSVVVRAEASGAR